MNLRRVLWLGTSVALFLGMPGDVCAQQDLLIADFESAKSIAKHNTTHKATVERVGDVPEGGGMSAVLTTVDVAAGASSFFGVGFAVPSVDLSQASEIRFWIKTDIAGTFNLQVHSGPQAVSVFRFSIAGSQSDTWQAVTAQVKGFGKPPWAQREVDWKQVDKVQITAFGGGPYDGKRLALDRIASISKALPTAAPVPKEPANGRGGPVILETEEPLAGPKSPPPGFRSLFDGKTLDGWNPVARLPVPKYPGAPFEWRLTGEALEKAKENTGRWTIEDGAIVGGQEPPGSGKGAYLVSEETFGDFELIMDMKPDWKTDSGFLVRTLPGGSPGVQVLVDRRPQGGIGGFYGNGLAGIHGMPFAIDAEYDNEGNPVRMIAARPDSGRVELSEKTRGILQYAADVEDFLSVWKFGQWNTIKVRCEGRIPTLTTWVNGVKMAVLEMSTLDWEDYDAEACAEMMGRRGHISLEVHNSNLNHWLGKDRWWPGAVVRWKNIFIRELEPAREREVPVGTPESASGPTTGEAQSIAEKPSVSHGPDFSRDIRPILSGKCFKCHGPDAGSREADLRLDLREAALDSGAIVEGSAATSSLMERVVTTDAGDRMPPKGKPLTAEEVDLLKTWIDAGAHYEQHWAYKKPEWPVLPTVDPPDWKRVNPIDDLVQHPLIDRRLEPSMPAEPAVLLRRLALDLTGLPPSLEEIDRFETDPSESAYEREVDRLLASNHFGEKWARHWLDLARYADSNGYQHDDLRTMWPYRDWVINALNEDLPFDRFTVEQLAGDLLPEPTKDQVLATGFHRNVATNFSGGSKVDEVRADILHDRVSTTGQVWLGMTLECSQCHDHKFDPISQVDYYELYAYFNQAVPELAMEGPGMFRKKFIGADLPVVASSRGERRLRAIGEEIAREKAALEAAKPRALTGQKEWEAEFLASGRGEEIPWERFPWNLRGGYRMLKIPAASRADEERLQVEALLFYDHPATGPHEKEIDRLKEERSSLVSRSMVMEDSAQVVPTNLFVRGDYTSPGERVEPGVPDVLHPLDPDLPPNRLGLARWLVDSDNPLTSRVTVNRFWAEIFGTGIVSTPEDFGMQSSPPTHPELLDWLALEFVRQGWSVKQLIKTIVMSATYRQTSAVPTAKIAADPSNQWLSRGPRFRLSAELVRDNLLAISGRLSRKIGGPSVFPPQPEGLWKEISGADVKVYPTSTGEDRHRRGLYTFLRRGNPNPMVLNFDGSNRSACVTKRDRSNTPVQALNLLNDPTYVEAAHAFADWIESSAEDDRSRAIHAFRRAVARPPSQLELAALLALQRQHGSWFPVAQAILNLDETITKS